MKEITLTSIRNAGVLKGRVLEGIGYSLSHPDREFQTMAMGDSVDNLMVTFNYLKKQLELDRVVARADKYGIFIISQPIDALYESSDGRLFKEVE